MASRTEPIEGRRPAQRLYLVTPPTDEPARLADTLAAALDAADIAAVLVALAGDDERALIKGVKALAPAIQDRGAALLLHGHADLVARAGVDGAHLPDLDEFNMALPTLRPERIAGCGGLVTRHEAMLAAEGGADYVMFGEPETAGDRPSFDAIIERVQWWAEVFEIPCVAYAGAFEEIAPLAAAGADFIALGPFVFSDARGAARVVASAAASLLVSEPAG
jgi:thiamine-phosphate pyrophosphorylase